LSIILLFRQSHCLRFCACCDSDTWKLCLFR
jgi:hypothetical protein